VLVEADVDKVLRDVGPVYGRVAARWEAYVQTLDDDQLLLAVELFRQAAQINRDETQRLRQERGNPPA
jgi:hypothetical protein